MKEKFEICNVITFSLNINPYFLLRQELHKKFKLTFHYNVGTRLIDSKENVF